MGTVIKSYAKKYDKRILDIDGSTNSSHSHPKCCTIRNISCISLSMDLLHNQNIQLCSYQMHEGLPLDNLEYHPTNLRLKMVMLMEFFERKGYVDYVTQIEDEYHFTCKSLAYVEIKEKYKYILGHSPILSQLLDTSDIKTLGGYILELKWHTKSKLQNINHNLSSIHDICENG